MMTTLYKEWYPAISDLKELRLRRGMKRGLITKLEHFYTTQRKIDFKLADLTKKSESLEELIKEHDTIQCRIE